MPKENEDLLNIPASADPVEAKAEEWDAEIEAWFDKHFRNKGYFNEAASACHAAKEDLLAFLRGFHHHPK